MSTSHIGELGFDTLPASDSSFLLTFTLGPSGDGSSSWGIPAGGIWIEFHTAGFGPNSQPVMGIWGNEPADKSHLSTFSLSLSLLFK